MSPCRQNMAAKNRYGRQIWTNLFSDQSNDVMQMKHNYYRKRIIKNLFSFSISALFGYKKQFPILLSTWVAPMRWGQTPPPAAGPNYPFQISPTPAPKGPLSMTKPIYILLSHQPHRRGRQAHNGPPPGAEGANPTPKGPPRPRKRVT